MNATNQPRVLCAACRQRFEVRQRCHSILGFSELLRQAPELSEQQRRFAHHMHQEAHQLLFVLSPLPVFPHCHECGELERSNQE